MAKPPSWTVKVSDAVAMLDALPPASVDLLFSSPPYCIGKAYEKTVSVEDFVREHKRVVPSVLRVLKPGGSVCWQVGHHVANNILTPLDALVHAIACEHEDLYLRNRIIWRFEHGVHPRRRFSGRHETVMWFTKGHEYDFDVDAVRVPQKYPGKRAYKGPNKGTLSGHPLGKNPGDVWDIPNVKARHVEKTDHPCQFPVALAARFVRALVPSGGLVADPYMGSGTTGVAAIIEGRRFVGGDLSPEYVKIATTRLIDAAAGTARVRPDVPAVSPNLNQAVATLPQQFAKARG